MSVDNSDIIKLLISDAAIIIYEIIGIVILSGIIIYLSRKKKAWRQRQEADRKQKQEDALLHSLENDKRRI